MARVILVTGAAGFVGSHLLTSLLSQTPTPTVVGWRRPGSTLTRTQPTAADAELAWHEIDVLDREAVVDAIAETQPAEVFHCAGIANVAGSWDNVVGTLEANVLGTQNVMYGLRRARVRARVLVPGSALVYRPKLGALTEADQVGPVSPYGLSKLAQEMQASRLASEEQQVVLTRSFTHIGPGQGLSYATSSFAHQIARIEIGQTESTIHVGLLDVHRDLMDVRDTVAAYQALMRRGAANRIYNVCSGCTYQMRDVVVGLVALAHVPIQMQVDPERVRPNDYQELCGDRSLITTDVGWQPQIGLEQMLNNILNYWRSHVQEPGTS